MKNFLDVWNVHFHKEEMFFQISETYSVKLLNVKWSAIACCNHYNIKGEN